ncbi:CPCC family cysteine-rich protein [Sutcliffiella horikoshii]|uniref:CPCC family cysteine-rich protein n=1 Tax=Sutcliffiella horikoshii TaxID=79883 RepID=UPI00384B9AE3
MRRYHCPCCGYRTLEEKPPGTYEICEICFWEDDEIQFRDPDYEGGANELSLRNFQKGVLEGLCLKRKPVEGEERNSDWKPFLDKVNTVNAYKKE